MQRTRLPSWVRSKPSSGGVRFKGWKSPSRSAGVARRKATRVRAIARLESASPSWTSTARARWISGIGSHGSTVENPACGAFADQGMGVRAPSRPWVWGQLAMASGSRSRSKGIWPGAGPAPRPDREKHCRAGSSAAPAAAWPSHRCRQRSPQRLTTRGASWLEKAQLGQPSSGCARPLRQRVQDQRRASDAPHTENQSHKRC